MTQGGNVICGKQLCDIWMWPMRTLSVSHVGSAHVLDAADDFDQNDLILVRRQFPGRHVTLDGNVITVWPTPSPNQ